MAPKPSGASSSISRFDATTDEVLIVDETEELLRQGITGHAIIGIRRPPRARWAKEGRRPGTAPPDAASAILVRMDRVPPRSPLPSDNA